MAPWWVRLLLRLYPADFRRARGAEVADFVAREMEGGGGGWTRVRLAVDLVRGAVRLRGRRRGRGDSNGEGWTMGVWSDVRLAARGLARRPGFSAVVVATLGLGIGLNAAVFSVVDGVLLEPLPYDGAGDLVYVQARRGSEDRDDALVSGGDWRALRDGMPALETLEAIGSIRQTLAGAGLPRQVQVGWVSPEFLAMLGVQPVAGRLMRSDDPPGTAVLSHALWANQLNADPAAIGRTVRLDGHTYTLVGVLPPDFRLELPLRGGRLPDIDVWKNPDTNWQNGDIWGQRGPEFGMLRMVGALGPGATLGQAQAQADAVVAALSEEDSRYQAADFSVTVHDLHDRLVDGVRPLLLLLMGAVGFVLLIACANVANLILVRAHGRAREVGVRVALGAARGRVVRLLLAETLVLAAAGAALGLGLAALFLEGMPLLSAVQLPRLDAVALDGTVVAFALSAAVTATLVAGLLPALVGTRSDPSAVLGNGRSAGAGGGRVRDALVVTQVALSMVLLVGAGLLVSSLSRMQDVDLGFEPEGLFTFAVSVPGTDYGWPEEAGRFYRDVQANVAALPGVAAAGVVWPMPFSGTWDGEFEAGAERRPVGVVPYFLATEEYFAAAEIPLVEGRLFSEADERYSVVLTERAARRAFPDGSSVGRVVTANPWGRGLEEYRVIGVVGDVRHGGVRRPVDGGVYFDARGWSWVDWEVHVVARTALDAGTLLPAIRGAVAEVDGDIPVARPRPMTELVADETATSRFVLALLGLFATAAAVLAVVGLYGVVSYTVGLRRRELGIRLALGAARSGVERLVVGRGVMIAGLGLALGVVGSWMLGGMLDAYLFEVRPGDPVTVAVAAALMAVATVAASWVPARRAGRTDPVRVLKAE